MRYLEYGYSHQELSNVEIICFDKIIYVSLTLHRSVLYWYHLYINYPGETRLANNNRQVCYWKRIVTQPELSIKTCKKCQQLKNRKTLYRHLPPKIIEALKPWNLVHIDLICTYYKSIRQ